MYCIKESFNKEFEEVFRLKKAEIARIQEKNVRISKIISQLKLEEAIVQPSLDADEEPERLLTVEVSHVIREARVMNTSSLYRCNLTGCNFVCGCFSVCPQDDEITVEKYISPEERRRMEEAEKQEKQRRLAEMVGDNLMWC